MGIPEQLQAVEDRISKACQASGRNRDEVRLLPVSKTKPVSAILDAHQCGYHRFGENRVQELVLKAGEVAHTDISFALIGPLQSNKAKAVAQYAAEFQALASLKLAARLDRLLHEQGRQLDVLIEVNSSGEASKHGLAPADVVSFAQKLSPFDALRVKGLMTIALPSPDPEPVKKCFATMADLQARLRDQSVLHSEWQELSMGMSGDLELAIAYGATTVRIGTAIFGPRGQ